MKAERLAPKNRPPNTALQASFTETESMGGNPDYAYISGIFRTNTTEGAQNRKPNRQQRPPRLLNTKRIYSADVRMTRSIWSPFWVSLVCFYVD